MSWGGKPFGSNTWGGAVAGACITIALTGVSATGSVGNVTTSTDAGSAALTQVSATGTVGTVAVSVTGGTCTLGPLTGNNADGSVGTVSPSIRSVTPSIVSTAGNYYTYPLGSDGNSPNTLSFDATGCNYLVVLISASYTYPDPTMTGITFNGVALTQRASLKVNDAYNPESEIWTLASPASGVHDLVTTWTGYSAWGLDITAIGLKNVSAFDQAATQAYTSGVTRDITVTSTAYDLCFALISVPYSTVVADAGQNEPASHTDDGLFLRHRIASKQGAGSSTTLGWTLGSTGSGTLAAVSLTGYGPAGSTVALTGNAATGSVGTVIAGGQTTVALTGVSAVGSVGQLATDNGGSELEQVSAIGSVGTTTPNITVALTGNSATGSVGTVTGVSSLTFGLTQDAATGSVGTVRPNITIALTGNQATGSVGTVTGLSSLTFPLTQVSATTSVGSISNVSITATLTGNNAFGSIGHLRPPIVVKTGTWKRGSGHRFRNDT